MTDAPPYDPLLDHGPTSREAAVMAAVRERDGVARASTLLRLGHPRHTVRMLLAGGRLLRVRRDWVAAPGADPFLVAAARAGVVLSCVSAARRLGLWVLDSDHRPHVAAPSHGGGHKPEKAVVHWARPVVARHPDLLVDPIENLLCLVAACQPHDAALAVWESALRQGLIDPLVLAGLPLTAGARSLLDEASPFSDSGLESFVVPRLRWLRLRIVPQAWIAGHRVDFLIGERLVLQIDGAHHVGPQRSADIQHDALLLVMGYHVIRVGYAQVVGDWPGVQQLVMRAVAQGLHRAPLR